MDFGRCHIINEWLEWDYSIHADEAQISRQGRAMNYPFQFKIDKEAKTAQFSSSSSLPYYTTSLSSCDCSDFQERKLPCKHIYRLAVELEIITIIKRVSSKTGKHTGNPTRHYLDEDGEIIDNKDIDNHFEQLKRQKDALDDKYIPIEINYDTKKAIFKGSDQKPYETTIDTCTCRDYFIRRLPCKHIYRLRNELESKARKNNE